MQTIRGDKRDEVEAIFSQQKFSPEPFWHLSAPPSLVCDPRARLFCLVRASPGLQELLRIHALRQLWSGASLMPSSLLSSLILGSRPSIPEKLIETEHQL